MANVKFVLDADEAKAVQGFLRVVDSQRKAEKGFDRVNRKIDKGVAKQGKFAQIANSSIGKMVIGWGSVGTAIAAATKLLEKHNAANDKAAARARSSEFSLGSLSQLATSKEDMARMVGEAQKTSKESGISLSDATRLQFKLESFGIAKQRKMFASLVGTVDDPSALADAAKTLQSAFGKEEAGGVRAILNKGFAASSVSKTTVNEMLTSIAQAAPGLKQVKASDEESLAALAILSKARKSSDTAATEIDAITAVLMKKGLGGKGLLAGIDAVGKEIAGKTDAEQLKYFGRKEGFKGYQTLVSVMSEVLSAQKAIQQGNQTGEKDRVASAIAYRRSVPIIREMEKTRISEQIREEATTKRRGVAELQAQQVINNEIAAAEERKDHWSSVAAREFGMEAAKYFNSSNAGIKSAGDFAAAAIDETDKFWDEHFNLLKSYRDAVDSLNRLFSTGIETPPHTTPNQQVE